MGKTPTAIIRLRLNVFAGASHRTRHQESQDKNSQVKHGAACGDPDIGGCMKTHGLSTIVEFKAPAEDAWLYSVLGGKRESASLARDKSHCHKLHEHLVVRVDWLFWVDEVE